MEGLVKIVTNLIVTELSIVVINVEKEYVINVVRIVIDNINFVTDVGLKNDHLFSCTRVIIVQVIYITI